MCKCIFEFLKFIYVYELIKHHEKENESNGLMDNVLKKYYNIFLTNLFFHILAETYFTLINYKYNIIYYSKIL
jgi:hypothetical protein